jgi:DNA-binding NtrC family response regulator
LQEKHPVSMHLVTQSGSNDVVHSDSETAIPCEPSLNPLTQAALHGITRALASVGRAFVCLDPSFRIVHVSSLLNDLLGQGAAVTLRGKPVEELLGEDLFGPGGQLRRALLDGQMREGWRATLKFGNSGPRLVSITTAPMISDHSEICDPLVRYLVLLRPAEEEQTCTEAPAFCAGAVGCSPAMQRIFRLVEVLQHSEASVLISGESGTGKEIVARAIHQNSPRSGGPFVAVNCGALPADLLESELFGHVRGAFTGAVRDRIGRFELASRGTLFLDEIGDVPPQLQVKLLRVLQERQYERVGESATRTTNARIIAATNVDLRGALRQGRMREDLYYRLCVVPIEVPPLRARREDIPPLVHHLLSRITAQRGLVRRVSPQAMRMLLDYSWPGNVRELSNVIEYAVVVAQRETILPDDLPQEVLRVPTHITAEIEEPTAAAPASLQPASVHVAPPDPDTTRLLSALEKHRWKRADAAKELGLSRSTLWRKMRELKLE